MDPPLQGFLCDQVSECSLRWNLADQTDQMWAVCVCIISKTFLIVFSVVISTLLWRFSGVLGGCMQAQVKKTPNDFLISRYGSKCGLMAFYVFVVIHLHTVQPAEFAKYFVIRNAKNDMLLLFSAPNKLKTPDSKWNVLPCEKKWMLADFVSPLCEKMYIKFIIHC